MKSLLRLTAIFLLGALSLVIAQAQSANMVKNGDFEKFTGDTPDGWDTSNIPGTLTVVSRTLGGNKGTRGVKCEVKDFYGTKISGFVCQKNIQLLGRELELSGYYVLHSVEKDAAVVIVCFLNPAGSTIGTVEEYFREEQRDFARFVKQFTAPDATTSVHVRLTILSGTESGSVHPGSYTVFDDIKLVAVPPKPKPVPQQVDSAKTQ